MANFLYGGGGSPGEINTASNVGTGGVGPFKQKVGVDLRFKNINAGSNKVTVTDDTANSEIDIDVAEANLTLNNIGGTLAVNKGGTGQTSYTDGQLLIGNTSTGSLSKAALTQSGSIVITHGPGSITIGGGGETNTASNVGAGGVGVFKQKTGVNFEFRNINAGSNKISVTHDAGNNEIDVDVAEANLNLGNLGGTVGTTQIANNAVTDTKLRDSAAYSVIGRSAASSGDPADIAASSAYQVLRRNASALDFSNQVLSGSTLPASPNTGDLFLHTPTGRKYLMQYDGSTWQPLIAYGTTTLYVNGTSGSDTQGKGFGTGTDAYATIQYAWNQIPAILLGNVTVNIASGTYREAVTLQGKQAAGNYTITLTGATTDEVAATTFDSATNPVGDGSAGYGTLTKTGAGWTVDAYQNMWIEITSGTGSGQIYPIHANTSDTVTIVGRWSTVPSGGNFRIFSLATRVTGANAGAETTPVRAFAFKLIDQQGVTLDKLKIDYAGLATTTDVRQGNVIAGGLSSLILQNCRVQGGSFWNIIATIPSVITVRGTVSLSASTADLILEGALCLETTNCRFTGSGAYGIYCSGGILTLCYHTYIGAATLTAVIAVGGGRVYLDGYFEADGSGASNVQPTENSIISFGDVYGARSTIRSINSAAWGVEATTGGFSGNASLITYSGNASGTYTPTTAQPGGTT